MHDLHLKLDKLEVNVKSLLRKLTEANHANNTLKNEINKLKEELRKKEAVEVEEKELVNVSTYSSHVSEEKYHKIKNDIKSCIDEIDGCIKMIEQ